MSDPATASGTFFDGLSARAHPVTLRLTERLELDGAGLHVAWDLNDLVGDAEMQPPFLRVSPLGRATRVEFADEAFAARLDAACPNLHRSVAAERGGRVRIVLWSLAAGLSVLLLAIYGVPALAMRLAPLVPAAIEAQIGLAVDGQVARILDDPPLCRDAAGRAALDRLLARLQQASTLPITIEVTVREHAMANALTLPGGRIVVLSGLIDQARSPDEFASVLAHEFGHAEQRDPMRNLLAASGTSFLLSVILGDLTGSTVIVAFGQAAISAGYSREAENAADAYSVATMLRAGGDAGALATMLERIDNAKDEGDAVDVLRSHPFTAERSARIRFLAGTDSVGRHILDETGWEALRGICADQVGTDED